MTLKLDSIDRAIADIAAGKPILVVDDEDRENEADLVMAASKATPEWVGFIIRHTGGVLCTPVTEADAQRLRLSPMVSLNDAPLSTAFTVSVDYREGLTTGISAEERCNTIRALANHNVQPEDFVRPGHVFPLVARAGGVLIRTGHTEAAVDLARLAELPPVGLISELVHDDGSVMKGDAIAEFGREHGLALVSIDDLIAYRQQREQLIERISETETQTSIGPARAFVYETPFDTAQHIALVFGDIASGADVLTRFQREDAIADVFNVSSETGLSRAMARIQDEGRGVIVYLRQGAVGVSDQASMGGRETHDSARGRDRLWRDIGLGAQIVKDLGLTSIRVLGSRERTYVGLSGFGVEITGTELLDG